MKKKILTISLLTLTILSAVDIILSDNDTNESQSQPNHIIKETYFSNTPGIPPKMRSPKVDTVIETFTNKQIVQSNTPKSNHINLTLSQAIDLAIANNPSIKVLKLEWFATSQLLKMAEKVYEPKLSGGVEHSAQLVNQLDLFSGVNSFIDTNTAYKAVIDGKLPTGTIYNTSLRHLKSFDRGTKSNEYTFHYGISLSQPLLKGTGPGAPTAETKMAAYDRKIAFQSLRKKLTQIVYEAEAAYWDLSFRQSKYELTKNSVKIAKELVQDSEQRLQSGKISELELYEANAGLAIRLANQSDAEQELLDAINKLKLIFSLNEIKDNVYLFASSEINLTEKDKIVKRLNDNELNETYSYHSDYLLRKFDLDKENLKVKYQLNETLPDIKLTGSYLFEAKDISIDKAYDKFLEKFKKLDLESWTIGVEVSIPIAGGQKERHLLKAAQYRNQAARENLRAIEYEIKSTISVIYDQLTTLVKQIENGREIIAYRDRLLEVSMLRLRAGKGNIREISEAEEKLAEAKQWHLENILKYRNTRMAYAIITGNVLREKGLEAIVNDQPLIIETAVKDRR